MTLRRALLPILAMAVIGCAVVPSAAPQSARADDVATLKADAVYHTEQIKTLGARQQTEIAQARQDVIRFEQSASAWESDYHSLEHSIPYTIGYWICVGVKWWALAVLIVFVARMALVYVGGPIGEFGAHLCTSLLGLLTCFTAYLVNIPDNVYFRRVLAAKDVEIADLRSQLLATTLAAAGATGAVAVATGQPASVDTTVAGAPGASVTVNAPTGGGT